VRLLIVHGVKSQGRVPLERDLRAVVHFIASFIPQGLSRLR
jgi:hypothetical protein